MTDKPVEIKHDPHSENDHATMFIVLLVLMVLSQYFLYYWKKKNYKLFQHFTLLGVWLIPFFISCYYLFYRMLCVWTGFTFYTLSIMYKATRKPLHHNIPRKVYTLFFVAYKLCYICAVLGNVLVFFDFIGLGLLLTTILMQATGLFFSFSYLGTLMIFYGLYYGVLGRDCAEMCAIRMASSMGYYSPEGLPAKHLDPNICCICGKNLVNISKPYDTDNKEQTTEKIFELTCKHQYHEFCIRGWTIIGKKDTCPYCSEKVNLKSMLRNPWDQSLLWGQVLDALRYLIVWNPVILLVVRLVYIILGFE